MYQEALAGETSVCPHERRGVISTGMCIAQNEIELVSDICWLVTGLRPHVAFGESTGH